MNMKGNVEQIVSWSLSWIICGLSIVNCDYNMATHRGCVYRNGTDTAQIPYTSKSCKCGRLHIVGGDRVGTMDTHLSPIPSSARVAFSVRTNLNTTSYDAYHRVRFSRTLANVGHAFDPYTSTVRIPFDGTYVMTFSLASEGRIVGNAVVWLLENGVRIANVRENQLSRDSLGGTANEGTLVGNHVVLELKAGDQLWLQIKEMGHVMSTGRIIQDNSYAITFTGYMLWLRN